MNHRYVIKTPSGYAMRHGEVATWGSRDEAQANIVDPDEEYILLRPENPTIGPHEHLCREVW